MSLFIDPPSSLYVPPPPIDLGWLPGRRGPRRAVRRPAEEPGAGGGPRQPRGAEGAAGPLGHHPHPVLRRAPLCPQRLWAPRWQDRHLEG